MGLISDAWTYALDPAVKMFFDLGFSRRATLRTALFSVKPSAQAYEEIFGVGAVGVDAWDNFKQSGRVSEADFDQWYKKTFTHEEYPLILRIQRKLLEDGQQAGVFSMAERLGDSAALKMEQDAASVFNNAFSSSYTGADSVSLCNDSHPYSPHKTGDTQDNKGTYSLTKPNVGTVREAMMAFTDDNGNKVGVTPDLLLVPPGLEDEALEITKSLLDPDSANNAINPQAGRFRVLTWHYLSDSNAWFMLDSNLMRQSLFWFDRVALTIDPMVEDKTIWLRWIAYMRYSYGWSDWRWVYGSNPS